ncbi:uncharacterized protein LOC117225168 [Megalopta genalis]|uniref:uncharacterized protein LOC117225168 n=1 Tax=Megalopta genalis TaxID=115081 RepID=UPI003FCF1B17
MAKVDLECAILSTALVVIVDQRRVRHKCRALLDAGSQANFISRECCERTGLSLQAVETMVGGLGRVKNPVHSSTQVEVLFSSGNFKRKLSCLVLETITEEMPNVPLNKIKLTIPKGVVPADPGFQTSGRIDLLIGAGPFWDLLCIGQIKVGLGNLMWQKTRLGWVLDGRLQWPKSQANTKSFHACHAIANMELENSISRFWEMEEINTLETKPSDHEPCELHFKENTKRDGRGRFIVAIPFNEQVRQLGESRTQAERRLVNLERKLRKNPDLRARYNEFLREYVDLGHMTKLEAKCLGGVGDNFYLPHHVVTKESSTTTKFRVVFDGSAKTSSGISLNDTQLVGPLVQDELFNILIRFRKHSIVLSAGVVKMYRQVLVREEDRKFQRILWRFGEDETIIDYSPNTVTYGTASASYLATRVLHQIGKECAQLCPLASAAILNDFYVGDLLTGCDTLEEALELRDSLVAILAQVGFPLRKWASNDPRVLASDADKTRNLEFKSSDREVKTLGLAWSVSSDELGYNVDHRTFPRITKRYVLAEIAQIFDPLGLIGPIIEQNYSCKRSGK